MWPGPYGDGGSRKYLVASLDQTLKRIGLDYVDIFYRHRPDPDTPLEETMGALASIVKQGKALYAGISSYGPELTERAADLLADMGVPLLIHQPSYSMLNRWVEGGLLDTLGERGIGCIAFSPAGAGDADQQVPRRASRRARGPARASPCRPTCSPTSRWPTSASSTTSPPSAASRWRRWRWPGRCATSGSPRCSSAPRRSDQLEDSAAAVANLRFSDAELEQIDRDAVDAGIDLWRTQSELA